MKIKTKKVYYCEYCKRHGLSSYYMKRHEKYCTLNPGRACRMCGSDQGDLADVIEKYKDAYEVRIVNVDRDDTYTIKEYKGNDMVKVPYEEWGHKVIWKKEVNICLISKDCGCCPNCILTVLRVCSLSFMKLDLRYDYKEAVTKWWKENENHVYDYD